MKPKNESIWKDGLTEEEKAEAEKKLEGFLYDKENAVWD